MREERHKGKHGWFVERNADAIRVDDYIQVHGTWMRVTRTKLLNRHPYQLYMIWTEDLKDDKLVIPAGWRIKVRDEGELP
jgi:hypothetical protein